MIDLLYPFKAVYYYTYFLYIKYCGDYNERVNLERIWNEVDYEYTYGESIYTEIGRSK